jgi:hypothetical protein
MARPTAGGRGPGRFGAFAAHAQHSVAMLFAEVGDVGGGGLEDPQPE